MFQFIWVWDEEFYPKRTITNFPLDLKTVQKYIYPRCNITVLVNEHNLTSEYFWE